MNSFSEKPQNRIHNLFPSSCTRVSIWFLLVFVLPFFYIRLFSLFLDWNRIRSASGFGGTSQTRSAFHTSTSTICLNTVGSFAYSSLYRLLFSGYFNRTSFGFLVSGSLLHVTASRWAKLGLGLLFSLYCANFSGFLFPLWPEITPILSILGWKNFSCFGCFWRLFRKQQQHSFAVSRELLHGACVDVISLFAVVARWLTGNKLRRKTDSWRVLKMARYLKFCGSVSYFVPSSDLQIVL